MFGKAKAGPQGASSQKETKLRPHQAQYATNALLSRACQTYDTDIRPLPVLTCRFCGEDLLTTRRTCRPFRLSTGPLIGAGMFIVFVAIWAAVIVMGLR